MKRRAFLTAQLAGTLAAAHGAALARPRLGKHPAPHAPALRLGPAERFNFDALLRRARVLATQPYVPPKPPAPQLVQAIDFDQVQQIRFRPACALWAGQRHRLPVRFFHLDRLNNLPVRIFALDGDQAREVLYSSQCFDYGKSGLPHDLPPQLGFSGFRVMDNGRDETDWLAFQGASYFRSSGQDGQYGASARGIAVNSAMSIKEEFPRFSSFWLAQDDIPGAPVEIYALLEGPSVTGAYHFVVHRQDAVIMEVRAEVFMRADVQRIGLAPLTSMYWYGENERDRATDWRPEIHDSDGLAMWTGRGERIWRPLIDPPTLQMNAFMDDHPKGFGLMQRDRDFDHYQDDGAFYNRRPGIWVEPVGDWGKGSVQLAEIPTEDETHDNIVAYWTPLAAVRKGAHLSAQYRLYWQDSEPQWTAGLAKAVATRLGRGGVPGQPRPEDAGTVKFVIDFEGGALVQMAQRFDVEAVVSGDHFKVEHPYVIKVVGTPRWRAVFDAAFDGKGPFNLRCFLRLGDKTLSETWLYQYFPGSVIR